MKLTTERLSSLLITSALFGTNIELGVKNKTSIAIQSPTPQQNLSTYEEVKDKIIGMTITDMISGKILIESNIPSTLDLSFLNTGLYILSIQMKSGEIARKMTVQQSGLYGIVRA